MKIDITYLPSGWFEGETREVKKNDRYSQNSNVRILRRGENYPQDEEYEYSRESQSRGSRVNQKIWMSRDNDVPRVVKINARQAIQSQSKSKTKVQS
jgi:hypothetical protein